MSSSPKPGPTPESLETARELRAHIFGLCRQVPDKCFCLHEASLVHVALALDAALQRGEKKGLQRAAEVAQEIADQQKGEAEAMAALACERATRDLLAEAAGATLVRDVLRRALMEAE